MPLHSLSCLRWLLLAWGLALGSAAHAEAARAVAAVELEPSRELPASAAPTPLYRQQIEIGSATQALWALQRASVSPHPRPIDGEQASRSYQRYLKSFETAIPDQYGTGLDLKK